MLNFITPNSVCLWDYSQLVQFVCVRIEPNKAKKDHSPADDAIFLRFQPFIQPIRRCLFKPSLSLAVCFPPTLLTILPNPMAYHLRSPPALAAPGKVQTPEWKQDRPINEKAVIQYLLRQQEYKHEAKTNTNNNNSITERKRESKQTFFPFHQLL